MNKRITNRKKVKEALNKAGLRLSIDEVSHLTGLTKTQVRNTANYYDNDIVLVGKGEIDMCMRRDYLFRRADKMKISRNLTI